MHRYPPEVSWSEVQLLPRMSGPQMELGQALFESDLHPLGDILQPLTKEGWIWIGSEGGDSIMAENEAPIEVPDGSSYLVLPVEEDPGPTVAVGVEQQPRMTELSLVEQMRGLEDLLREFGQRIGYELPQTRTSINAQKAMYRCVDTLRYFNDNG